MKNFVPTSCRDLYLHVEPAALVLRHELEGGSGPARVELEPARPVEEPESGDQGPEAVVAAAVGHEGVAVAADVDDAVEAGGLQQGHADQHRLVVGHLEK